jgi:hypothetical protein
VRLDTFLLADAAAATPDGKLYIHGGGITRLTTSALPLLATLAVVVRFQMEPKDFRTDHTFSLSLSDPDGSVVLPPVPIEFPKQTRPQLPKGEETFLQVALNLGAVTFSRAGAYKLKFAADGHTVRQMTLPVVALSSDELEQMMKPPSVRPTARSGSAKGPAAGNRPPRSS